MTKLLRVAIYSLTSKPGRENLIKIISIILCLFFIPIILLSGFSSTYFSFFGGISSDENDVYTQAISEVKEELSIANNLEACILRAIYYKQNNTLEIEKNLLVDEIKTYFVKSESKERTVKEEDIKLLTKQIDDLKKQLDDENKKQNKNHNQIEKIEKAINELNLELKDKQNIFDSEKDIEYSFFELQEIKEILKKSPFSFDDKFIYEIENYAIYINGHTSINFDNITFENETANNTQKRIVEVAISASDYGIKATKNQCEAWVADIYQKVLGVRGYAPSAILAGRAWSVSADWSKIQVGAAVYGTASQQYGHVGIYIGNGLVIHNLSGYVKTESLESWVKSYNGKCWGWENAQNLTGNPIFNCVGGMI